MKIKITAIFALFILLTGFISVFSFVDREKALELHWLTENSRSQLDLMGDLLQNDLEKMKNQLAQVATLMESNQTEEAQKNLGMFIAAAALNLDTNEFIWKTQLPRRSAETGSSPVLANDEWAASWVQKTKESSIDDSELRFFVSQSPQGEIRSALSVPANVRDHRSGQVNKVRLIGIRSQTLFQDYIDKLKVQGIHIFLTTQSGLTLAHSVSEYVGNSMVGDRTYEQIRSQKDTFGTIITQDVRGDDILSFFVKLPVGKLTLVSQWRKELWLATDWTYYGQSLLIILALTFLAGALAQYLLKHYELDLVRKGIVAPSKSLNELSSSPVLTTPSVVSESSMAQSPSVQASTAAAAIPSKEKALSSEASSSSSKVNVQQPKVSPSSVSPSDTLPIPSRPPLLFATPLATPEVREPQVPMRILDKVVSALRAPLLSVLGHVQMARLNPQGGALQSIETEVRNAREVLDKVGQFSGHGHVPSVTVALYEIIESALRTMEGSLLRNNIKIIREIPPELAIKCDVDDFKAALMELFKNAIESMEKSLKRNLFIKASKVNTSVHLEIEDTGEGISSENLEKSLDPFFTTRSTLDHSGLGLSMASGILRQHTAQMQLKSKMGEGTTIIIKLPTSQEVVQPLANCIMPRKTISKEFTPSFERTNLTSFDKQGMTFYEGTNPSEKEGVSHLSAAVKQEAFGTQQEPMTQSAENDILKSFNLLDDDDGIGDFQFGRLDFTDEAKSLNLGEEKAAQEVMTVSPPPPVEPSKKLKKKDDGIAKIKVQIPRPEEKI